MCCGFCGEKGIPSIVTLFDRSDGETSAFSSTTCGYEHETSELVRQVFGEKDPNPFESYRPHSGMVFFAACALGLVTGCGPRAVTDRASAELMKALAQELGPGVPEVDAGFFARFFCRWLCAQVPRRSRRAVRLVCQKDPDRSQKPLAALGPGQIWKFACSREFQERPGFGDRPRFGGRFWGQTQGSGLSWPGYRRRPLLPPFLGTDPNPNQCSKCPVFGDPTAHFRNRAFARARARPRARALAAHNAANPAAGSPVMVNDDKPSSYNRRG
jgi:hypothetical protein